MLSRVAETMYWLARQVERAENAARIVAVNANLLLDLPRGIAPGWRPLVDITGAHALFEEHYSDYDETQVLHFLLGDERNPGPSSAPWRRRGRTAGPSATSSRGRAGSSSTSSISTPARG